MTLAPPHTAAYQEMQMSMDILNAVPQVFCREHILLRTHAIDDTFCYATMACLNVHPQMGLGFRVEGLCVMRHWRASNVNPQMSTDIFKSHVSAYMVQSTAIFNAVPSHENTF